MMTGISLKSADGRAALPSRRDRAAMVPMRAPYLCEPTTDPLHLDAGRQLFVDDYLIADTNLTRRWHTATVHPASPVLVPDRDWEGLGEWKGAHARHAMPFSDGVWFDPADDLFKMWYMGGMLHATGYATSTDGVHWRKPELDIVPGTNIVHPGNRDANVIWIDDEAPPEKRFKMFRFQKVPRRGLVMHDSPDGIHWSEPTAWAGPCADRTTVFRNPFRGTWVFSIKGFENVDGVPHRVRRYWETPQLNGKYWDDDKALGYWVGADEGDRRWRRFDRDPQLYNLDAAPYESGMLGLFTILHGPPDEQTRRQKINEVAIRFSRDGFHWTRGGDEPFIGVSDEPGDWRWGNVQSAGGGCVIVGDRLYFYFSARARLAEKRAEIEPNIHHGVTGLATLRRDGFASMSAGEEGGSLTTVPMALNGRYLFVNTDCPRGRLTAEWLDADGRAIAPFSADQCRPIQADSTCHKVAWQNSDSLAALRDQPVRLRLHLKNGAIYAFWLGDSPTGESGGYLAAGGPGYACYRDEIPGSPRRHD